MSLVAPRFVRVNTVEDAARSFNDLQVFLDQLMLLFGCANTPPAAGDIKLLALDSTGTAQLYSLVAGVGVTITRNDTAKTWTVSSP